MVASEPRAAGSEISIPRYALHNMRLRGLINEKCVNSLNSTQISEIGERTEKFLWFHKVK